MSGALLTAWIEADIDTSPVLPQREARHSDIVRQNFGVQVFPTFNNEYREAHYDDVRSLVDGLGCGMVRGQAPYQDAAAAAWYRELWTDLGVPAHWTTGVFIASNADRTDLREFLLDLDSTAKAGIHSVGSYNEPNGARVYGHVVGTNPGDNHGDGTSCSQWWYARSRTHQEWLWQQVNGPGEIPGLGHVIVCGPSLHDHPPGRGLTSEQRLQDDYLKIADHAPFMDRINFHRYPSGQLPSNGIDQRTGWAQEGVGVKPVVCTETGYNNGTDTTFTNAVPPAQIGIYADRMLHEHVSRTSGTDEPNICCWFELLNNAPPTSNDHEHFYGLVEVPADNPATWEPMPAYDTLSRNVALFADPGVPYDPPALGLEILPGSGMSASEFAGVRSSLWGKRDGTYQLAVWRDLKVYNTQTNTVINPAGENLEIGFETAYDIEVYRPSTSASPVDTVTGTGVTVSLDEHLLVLDLSP